MEAIRRRERTLRRVPVPYRITGELLLAFGVLPHMNGYRYLCEGIRIRAEREGRRYFPADGGKPVGESIMRGAIGAGFFMPGEIHARFFPHTDRPSNSEFICTLAMLAGDRIHAEQ